LTIAPDLEPAELKFRPLLPNLDFKIRCGDSLIQEVGGINFSEIKSDIDVSTSLKGRITTLRGEKQKFYNGDPNRKFQNEEDLKHEERRVFIDLLEDQITRNDKEINKLNKFLTGSHGRQTSIFGDDAPDTVFEKQSKEWNETISILSLNNQVITRARKDIERLKEIPFVWDIAFVEIFSGGSNGFDIVIGNPPYVRQEQISDPKLTRDEITTENKKEYKKKLIRSVYQKYPWYFGRDPNRPAHKLDAKSDLYIYFYFHGLSLLNRQGTFSFITSNSWLDVGYGKNLQEFLLQQSHVKLILDNQAKRSFKEADVNTIIAILSAPDKVSDSGLKKTARFVMFKLPFENILSPILFEEIDEARKRKSCVEYRIHTIKQDALLDDGWTWPEDVTDDMRKKSGRGVTGSKYTGNKWGGKYLRAPDIYWTIMEKGKGKLVRLGDIAEVRFGIKTGANEFFYLDDEKIAEWGIEKEFLRPVIKSPRECKSILINPDDLKFKIFMCHKNKKDLKGTRALEYIKWGEKKRFHDRPSCRGRRKWWDLGDRRYSPLICPSSVSELFRVFSNRNVLADKRLYEIYPEGNPDLIQASLNSTLSTLFLELGSRTGLGEGLLDMTVYEVADCPVIVSGSKEAAKLALKMLCLRNQMPITHELQQPDRIALDNVIFDLLGLTESEREAVYEAVTRLVEDRLNKAGSV